MEWLTKHFAVVSAVLVFGAATTSIFFLFGYLSEFDLTLIWLIEYTDLAKMFLIFGALICGAGLTTVMINLGQEYYRQKSLPLRQRLSGFIAVGGAFLVLFAINLYVDFQARNDLVWFHSFLTLCELGFLFLLFVILDKYSRLIDGDWSMVFMVLGLVIILVPITGKVYGMYVKQVAATHVTIWSRREEFADARVIMWFPHHVAFYTGRKVIVLPTADVVQVEMERN